MVREVGIRVFVSSDNYSVYSIVAISGGRERLGKEGAIKVY